MSRAWCIGKWLHLRAASIWTAGLPVLHTFLVLLSSVPLSGQVHAFVNYTSEHGLVHNQVHDIIQSSDRKLWIATSGGVSCFNGSVFTNFTTRDGLASDQTTEVFEDNAGRIWVGTRDNGVSVISDHQIHTPSSLSALQLGSVGAFLEGSDSTLYIFFDSAVVSCKNDQYTLLTAENSDLFPTAAVFVNDSTIMLSSRHRCVFRVRLNPFSFDPMDSFRERMNDICYSIHVDADGDIWVGSYGVLYQIHGDSISEYVPDYNDLDNNRVFSIWEDSNTQFTLATEGNGFATFDKTSGRFHIINHSNGLPSRYLYNVIKDVEHNYWMATYDRGIVRFRDTSFKLYDASQGLQSDLVHDIIVWNDRWLVGTNRGLSVLHYGTVTDHLFRDTIIYDLTVAWDGSLLLSTGEGVYKLRENLQYERIHHEHFFRILGEENRLVLLSEEYVHILEGGTRRSTRNEKTTCIQKVDSVYLVSTSQGLFLYDGYRLDTIAGLSPLKHRYFNSIEPLSQHTFLAASQNSIYKMQWRGTEFDIQQYRIPDGGQGMQINAMATHGNDIWTGSNHAIGKIDMDALLRRDTFITTVYDRSKGFPWSEIREDGLRVTEDGIVLAATNKGLIAFDEKAFVTADIAPVLLIREVRVFSEVVPDSLYRSGRKLELANSQNNLTFAMDAIAFTYPGEMQFRYRLNKQYQTEAWSAPTRQKQVVFSALPPGSYTFQFTADNGDGVWQEESYDIEFAIKVPFWQTWWFWFVMLLSLAGMTMAWMTWRSRRARMAHEKFARELINAQEQERTRVARELHDSVGQKMALLVRKIRGTEQEEIEDLAEDLLAELRSVSRDLHPAYLEQLGLSAAIEHMINEVDAHTAMLFEHEIENVDAWLSQDRALHLYRICQELLSNIIKHAQATEVHISMKKTGMGIELRTEDNGRGFDSSELSGNTTSLGLRTLRERINILDGHIRIHSKTGLGTQTIIEIPVQPDRG